MKKSVILTNGVLEYEFTTNVYGNNIIIGRRPMKLGEVYYEKYNAEEPDADRRRVVTEEDVANGKMVCFFSEIYTTEAGNEEYKRLRKEGFYRA